MNQNIGGTKEDDHIEPEAENNHCLSQQAKITAGNCPGGRPKQKNRCQIHQRL